MATVVEFACPACSARCCAHTRRGQLVRCPHCFNFVTIPETRPGQLESEAPTSHEAPAESNPADDVLPDDAPPMIVFMCTHCQTRIETDPANAGLACMCPGCHVNLTIPGNAKPLFARVPSSPEPAPMVPVSDNVRSAILFLVVLTLGALLALLSMAWSYRPYP